jgi:hypothetical protein
MEHAQKASLGCGTLILIALIVMIFGNQGGRDETLVRGLRDDVQKLQKTVGAQTSEIESLKQMIRKLSPPPPQPKHTTKPTQLTEPVEAP